MSKTILITLVVAVVVGVAAGLGGYKIGDSAGFQRANLVRQQFAQQRQAQFGQGNGGGFSGGGGGAGRAFALQGTIKSVEGDTVTITVGQRDVQVKLSDKTQIEKAASGDRTELATGARVMVTPDSASGNEAGTGGGAAAASNSFNAASILILSAQ